MYRIWVLATLFNQEKEKKVLRAFVTTVTLACGCTAMFCVYLGLNWMSAGYGLHPMLAGAMAVGFGIFPYLIELSMVGGREYDEETDITSTGDADAKDVAQ